MIKFINNVVVIPFNLPWEWSTDYLNQTALLLSKKNTVIGYMWSEQKSVKEYLQEKMVPKFIEKKSNNLYLFYPTQWIPFRRSNLLSQLNTFLNFSIFMMLISLISFIKKPRQKFLWIFDPALEPLSNKFNKKWKIIYDCVDFFIDVAKTAKHKKRLIKLEHKLCKKADIVTGNSTVLVKHLKKYRKDVFLVPQGFRIESFKKFKKNVPQIKRKNRSLIGFLGAVNHRLDYELFYKLAKNNPQWDFALWGPLLEIERFTKSKTDNYNKVINLPNVITGQSGKKDVPGIINQFDVGIIPYDPEMDFNKYCHPMKIFEYFYLGKPTVSTEIIELHRFPELVKISNNLYDWQKYIEGYVSKPWPKKYKIRQMKLAEENSWKNKIKTILKKLYENQ